MSVHERTNEFTNLHSTVHWKAVSPTFLLPGLNELWTWWWCLAASNGSFLQFEGKKVSWVWYEIQGWTGGRAPGLGWHSFWVFHYIPASFCLGSLAEWAVKLGQDDGIYKLSQINTGAQPPAIPCTEDITSGIRAICKVSKSIGCISGYLQN